jgi:hypothetical protein
MQEGWNEEYIQEDILIESLRRRNYRKKQTKGQKMEGRE